MHSKTVTTVIMQSSLSRRSFCCFAFFRNDCLNGHTPLSLLHFFEQVSSPELCDNYVITGRNEVLAKVIFSQACVILSTGGGGYLPGPGGWSEIFGAGCLKFSGGGGVSEIFGGGCLTFGGAVLH